MNITKIASFSDKQLGGNPAGVLISEQHPSESEMHTIAAAVGFSETAFAAPYLDGWRVRYFSPESEVPFCGHATIALGAQLTKLNGAQVFPLYLNKTQITVEGMKDDDTYAAALQSPPTSSRPASTRIIEEVLNLFGYTVEDLDPNIPPTQANGGANHLIIGLRSRSALSEMKYELNEGRAFMLEHNFVTVMFVFAETLQRFHSRNAFASGGVIEDPATGAASAAFAGYLRDIQWAHGGVIEIVQGEDMGSRSLIRAEFDDTQGSSIRVSGSVRFI